MEKQGNTVLKQEFYDDAETALLKHADYSDLIPLIDKLYSSFTLDNIKTARTALEASLRDDRFFLSYFSNLELSLNVSLNYTDKSRLSAIFQTILGVMTEKRASIAVLDSISSEIFTDDKYVDYLKVRLNKIRDIFARNDYKDYIYYISLYIYQLGRIMSTLSNGTIEKSSFETWNFKNECVLNPLLFLKTSLSADDYTRLYNDADSYIRKHPREFSSDVVIGSIVAGACCISDIVVPSDSDIKKRIGDYPESSLRETVDEIIKKGLLNGNAVNDLVSTLKSLGFKMTDTFKPVDSAYIESLPRLQKPKKRTQNLTHNYILYNSINSGDKTWITRLYT